MEGCHEEAPSTVGISYNYSPVTYLIFPALRKKVVTSAAAMDLTLWSTRSICRRHLLSGERTDSQSDGKTDDVLSTNELPVLHDHVEDVFCPEQPSQKKVINHKSSQ